jgi:streptomycin 6-kinase
MRDLLFQIPPRLKWLEGSSDGRNWLDELPARLKACTELWSLKLGPPYQDSQVSIVFPATLPDHSPAVLKLQFPHPECEHEAEALRRWNGHGAVRLIAWEPSYHALLLEKCEPGYPLSSLRADEALDIFIDLLPQLSIPAEKPFRSLAEECLTWSEQLPACWEQLGRPFETELLNAALEVLATLPKTQGEEVLVHQDLHGDNVLRASREPWLAIDPKPLLGEREFSLAPIVRSYEFGHSRKEVLHRLDRLAIALHLDRERARLWSMAQTLAWATDGKSVLSRHVETARWLWQG